MKKLLFRGTLKDIDKIAEVLRLEKHKSWVDNGEEDWFSSRDCYPFSRSEMINWFNEIIKLSKQLKDKKE